MDHKFRLRTGVSVRVKLFDYGILCASGGQVAGTPQKGVSLLEHHVSISL